MKVVQNNIIPFPGYLAINIFGVVFVRKSTWAKKSEERRAVALNHEAIHTAQMRELFWVPFYLVYFLEWICRLLTSPKTAYRSISFEREAYEHQEEFGYIINRRKFAQWRKTV